MLSSHRGHRGLGDPSPRAESLLGGDCGREMSRAYTGKESDISEERKAYVDRYVSVRYGNKPRYILQGYK